MKILCFVLAMMVGCAVNPVGRLSIDYDALAAQEFMVSTVLIETKVIYDVLRQDPETKDWSIVSRGEIAGSRGTGFVVKVNDKNNTSIVMTANHVGGTPVVGDVDKADVEGENIIAIVTNVSHTVKGVGGEKCNARSILSGDKSTKDVALMKVDCVIGEPVKFAKNMPPIGAIVAASGVPNGIKPVLGFYVLDGRFIGYSSDGYILLTIPVIGGASGSAVFYHGMVVCMIVRVVSDFNHQSSAIDLPTLLDFMSRMPKDS